jgi:hypothetical protein
VAKWDIALHLPESI